jgi:hypothetical protein
VTGVFRPLGARNDGHDAMTEASDAQEAKWLASPQGQARMRDHVPRMFESGAGMKQKSRAVGTAPGGSVAPSIFDRLIETGTAWYVSLGYLVAALLLIAAAVAEFKLGVDAEGKSLEAIAAPFPVQGSCSRYGFDLCRLRILATRMLCNFDD